MIRTWVLSHQSDVLTTRPLRPAYALNEHIVVYALIHVSLMQATVLSSFTLAEWTALVYGTEAYPTPSFKGIWMSSNIRVLPPETFSQVLTVTNLSHFVFIMFALPSISKINVLHGVLMSCSFYRYPELLLDLIAYHNTYIYAMVSFSAGNSTIS